MKKAKQANRQTSSLTHHNIAKQGNYLAIAVDDDVADHNFQHNDSTHFDGLGLYVKYSRLKNEIISFVFHFFSELVILKMY